MRCLGATNPCSNPNVWSSVSSHCAYCQMNEPYNLQHTTIQMLKSYTFVMAIKSAIVLVLYK